MVLIKINTKYNFEPEVNKNLLSVFLIFKFDTDNQLLEIVEDEDFQLYKSKIECLVAQKGGNCEFLINSMKEFY